MEVVKHNPLLAGVPLGQLRAPEPEKFSLGQTAVAAFAQESDVVNAIAYLSRPEFPRDPDFDILKALEEDEDGERYALQLARAQSADEYASIKSRILAEERNRQIIAANPVTGFISAAAAGLISPTSLIPFVGPSRGIKGVAEAFALAGAAVSAQEAALYALQETRTKEEVLTGIAVGTVLGGLLGSAAKYMSPAERAMIESRMAASPGETTIRVPREDGTVDEIELVDGSLSAAAAPRVVPEQLGRRITRKKTPEPLTAQYGGSYLRADLPNDYEVRFTKKGAKEYVATVVAPDGTQLGPAIPTGQTAVQELRAAYERGDLDAKIDDAFVSVGQPRMIEAASKAFESFQLSRVPVREKRAEITGIKRANTFVGRQVDRGADWLAAKSVPVVPKVIKTLNDPIGVLSKLSPLTRQLENKVFPSVRGWAAQMQVPGLKLEGTPGSSGDAYSRHRIHYRAQAEFIEEYDAAWADYVSDGKGKPAVRSAVAAAYKASGKAPAGKMSYREFGERVFLEAQTREDSDDPAISAAIHALRGYFDYVDNVAENYHRFRLEQDGSLNEDGVLSGVDPLYRKQEFEEGDELQFYVHHIFDDVAVEKNAVEFLDDLTEHGKELLNSSYKTSYERYSKRREKLDALRRIMGLDEEAINTKLAAASAERDAIDEVYGSVLKHVKKLRKAMKAAGADKEEIERAVLEFENNFGPEYRVSMKRRKQLDAELSVLRKAGAGLTEKQIDLYDQLDELEEMQLDELEKLVTLSGRISKKLEKLSEKEAGRDASIKKDYEAFRKASVTYLNSNKRAQKLESSDPALAAVAAKKADSAVDRMNSALKRIEELESLDFPALREAQQEAVRGLIVRTKELNAKRVLREEAIKERIAKSDPDERAKLREESAANLRQQIIDLEDAFETQWRAQGATGQPLKGTADFTEQARADAEKLYRTIVGNPLRVIGIEVLGAERGPQLQRVLNLPLDIKAKYLVREPEAVVRAHSHSMFPDLELYKLTGSVNAAPIFAEIEADHSRALAELSSIPAGPQREKASQQLEKAYQDTVRDWQVLIDRFRHKRAIPSNPNGILYRAGRFASNLNVTRFMGMVMLSSLPDAARVVFRYGVNGAFRDAWKPLITDLPRVRALRAEANRFGIALDPLLHSRAAMINETLDHQSTRQNLLERGMEFLANKTGFIALFDRWTAEMQYLATNAVISEMSHNLRVVSEPAKFSAKEVAKAEYQLAQVSVNKTMARRIWAQYNRPNGSTEFKDGFRLPNTEAWDDFDAEMAMKAAVTRVVNDLIITPALDRPSWMDENMAFRLVAQFRSFTYTSTTRILMSGLQEPDMVFLQGAIFSLALGALSYYTWAATAGDRAWNEAMNAEPEKWLYEAVNRSGILAVLSEGQRIGEQIPGLNDWAIFGSNENVSRRAGSLLGAVLGPTYDLAERLANVVQGMSDPTANTIQQARTAMVPYQNVFYLRGLLDMLQDSLVTGLGIPERREQ